MIVKDCLKRFYIFIMNLFSESHPNEVDETLFIRQPT